MKKHPIVYRAVIIMIVVFMVLVSVIGAFV